MGSSALPALAFPTRLILRGARLRWRRGLLTLLTAAVAVIPIVSYLALSAEVTQAIEGDLAAFGPNLLVIPESPAPGVAGARLDSRVVDRILALPESDSVRSWVPFLYGTASVGRPGTGTENGTPVVVAGTDFERVRAAQPWWQMDGRWPAVGSTPADSVVGEVLARTLNLTLDSSQSLRAVDPTGGGQDVPPACNCTIRIAAEVRTGGGEDQLLFIPLPLAQELLGAPGQVSVLQVRVASGDRIGPLARAIDAIPGADVRTIEQLVAGDRVVLATTSLLLLTIAGEALVCTSLAAVAIAGTALAERRSEVGLLVALGARAPAVRRLLGGDLLLYGAIGGAGGYALGWAMAASIGAKVFERPIPPELLGVLAALLIPFVLFSLATRLAVHRALAAAPVEALREG